MFNQKHLDEVAKLAVEIDGTKKELKEIIERAGELEKSKAKLEMKLKAATNSNSVSEHCYDFSILFVCDSTLCNISLRLSTKRT
jgi:hypothetical protein